MEVKEWEAELVAAVVDVPEVELEENPRSKLRYKWIF